MAKVDIDTAFPWELTIRVGGRDYAIPAPTVAETLADLDRADLPREEPTAAADAPADVRKAAKDAVKAAVRGVRAIFGPDDAPDLDKLAWPDLLALRDAYNAYLQDHCKKKQLACREMLGVAKLEPSTPPKPGGK